MNEVYMKCLSVLASCRTQEHFLSFDRYLDLAKKHLTQTQFSSLLGRSYVLETELFEKGVLGQPVDGLESI